MKYVVDVGGCDNPQDVIKGVEETLEQTNANLVVFGNEELIRSVLSAEATSSPRLEIVNAEETITNNDSPMTAIRSKKNSSLVLALKRLASDEECGAIISAGSTGAVLCGATVILGRKPDVERPTLATLLPSDKGGFVLLADCGANVDCRPEQLLSFAKLGSECFAKMFGKQSPTVATLSVGTEDKKGNELTKSAFALIKESGLNFIGNIEAKTIISGDADVIVCDGFDGNVVLKCTEGTAVSVAKRMMKLLAACAPQGTDLTFTKVALKKLFETLDFTSQGGAFLLGVKKAVIKAHGAANAQTVVSCVKQAISMCE